MRTLQPIIELALTMSEVYKQQDKFRKKHAKMTHRIRTLFSRYFPGLLEKPRL